MFLSSFAVLALIPYISASFPGSTFGIAYNSSSPAIPSPGHLTTVKTSPESTTFFTTASDSTQDIGGFFTMSGTEATLNNACSGGGIAALVPVDPPVAGLKFLLQWSTETSTLPAGSNLDGFILGPSPTYDTLQNENVRISSAIDLSLSIYLYSVDRCRFLGACSIWRQNQSPRGWLVG